MGSFQKVSRVIIDEVYAILAEELGRLGLRRKTSHLFVLCEDRKLLAGIGVVHDHLKGYLTLAAYVQFQHYEIERLISKTHKEFTYSLNLDEFIPNSRRVHWELRSKSIHRTVIRSLALAIKQHGIPFLANNSTLSRLHSLLNRRWSQQNDWNSGIRCVAAKFLLSRKLEARRLGIELLEKGLKNVLVLFHGESRKASHVMASKYKRLRLLFSVVGSKSDLKAVDAWWLRYKRTLK